MPTAPVLACSRSGEGAAEDDGAIKGNVVKRLEKQVKELKSKLNQAVVKMPSGVVSVISKRPMIVIAFGEVGSIPCW